ncbi:MAG: cbb3-type cytochrome oxidase assembly protein CcoS [Gammaproteobacteria bacterium]
MALALWAFFWAVDAGQFEDLESPGWSVLEEPAPPPSAEVPATADDGRPSRTPEP